MTEKAREFLDRNIEQFISRKFLAWVVATVMCMMGTVTSDNWVAITLAYIGTQALVDSVVKWKYGFKGAKSC